MKPKNRHNHRRTFVTARASLWSSRLTRVLFAKIGALLIFISWVQGLAAQSGFDWNKLVWQGNHPSAFPLASYLAVDPSGNCFVTGYFPGRPNLFNGTNVVEPGVYPFLVKYTPAGAVTWAIPATAAGESLGLAVDPSGNSYVTLDYTSVAKYNSSGVRQWLVRVPNLGPIGVDGSGNASVFFQTSSNIILSKLDSSGNATNIASIQGNIGYDCVLAVNQTGSVFLAGSFHGNMIWSGTPLGGTNLFTRGQGDVFLAKYDSTGNLDWVVQAGGTNNEFATSIALDGSGNAYLCGEFVGTATFVSIVVTSSTAPNGDFLVAKLDGLGNFLWVRQGSLEFVLVNNVIPRI